MKIKIIPFIYISMGRVNNLFFTFLENEKLYLQGVCQIQKSTITF